MKNRSRRDDENRGKSDGPVSGAVKRNKKKNLQRLGGGGLSLQVFANAKSTSNHYNPALIKKQREFYKNAKFVSKYKKSLKQQNQLNAPSSSMEQFKDDSGIQDEEVQDLNNEANRNDRKKSSLSLREVYEKNEKARMEREAIINDMNKEREKAKSRRKSATKEMFKKTKKGQPVMKFRIQHLFESIQGLKKTGANFL